MTLYVHIADRCQSEAKKYGSRKLVENIKRSIETSQNLTGFNNAFFPFSVKGLGKHFRLIAYRWKPGEEDDELVVFCRVLGRGSKDYKDFLANEDKDKIVSHFLPYDSARLQQIYAECKRIPPPPPPPRPSEEEQAWLYRVLDGQPLEDELLVLETESWVKKMRRPENRDFLVLYHQILEGMTDVTHLHAATTNVEYDVRWEERAGNDRVGIVYLYRPDFQRLLLIEPLHHNGYDIDTLLQEHLDRLQKLEPRQRELSRVAARSYPLCMVLDRNAWLAIQKDEKTNLALSPEEAELLESIRPGGDNGQGRFPLFINGRAGSGKSTMLQYLVADYIDFALRQKSMTNLPIYITYSQDLLKHARNVVKGLLTVHHSRLLKGPHDTLRVDRILEQIFVVFRDFLSSLLPLEVQRELLEERYVNYAKFCSLWDSEFARRPEAKRLSPDIAWHIIRSYIKGMRSGTNDELLPEEFEALPRDRKRSVLVETYRQVYEHVWTGWYKKLHDDKGYWDDQDLAAYVLDEGLPEEVRRVAIFCDEAQDFTPIELEIIFQLSLFGRRSLFPEELCRVPIVFAGDPLQTINPTGFRWKAVKADFYDRFYAVLDPRRKSRVEINDKDLDFNYRSNPGIVGFSNLIQLVRAALFENNDIQPQETWWVESPVQPVWFYLDTSYVKQKLYERPEITKVINCKEGEETEYADHDEILMNLEKTEGVYREIWSPIRAKGLEFPIVVLYRFGETVPDLDEFNRILDDPDVVDLSDPERQLPYEYFFNRLYVAASRAKSQLIIVDSKEAIEKFWRFATDLDVSERLMRRLRRKDRWENTTTFMTEGKEKAWSSERVDPIDPNERGKEYEEKGRRKRDPYTMRQAALAYRSAGNEHQAGVCLALAAEFEDKLQIAGDKYRDIGLYENAFRCYWKGSHWNQVNDLAAQSSRFTARLESRAADFMVHRGLDKVFIRKLVDASQNSGWVEKIGRDATWREVLKTLAARLSKSLTDDTLPWTELYDTFSRLKEKGILVNDEHLAVQAYKSYRYEEAVSLWERSGNAGRKEYMHARAMVTPFPGNLIWFRRMGDNAEVLRQWHMHHSKLEDLKLLNKQVVYTIVEAVLEEKRDLSVAASILRVHPDRERVAKLLATAIEVGDSRVATEIAELLVRLFVRQGSWEDAIRAAEDGKFSLLSSKLNRKLRGVLDDTDGRAIVLRAVIQELSQSRKLPQEETEVREIVFKFLHRHFIREPYQYDISPMIVGGAIERTGKVLEALHYYADMKVRPKRVAKLLEGVLKADDSHTVTQATEVLVRLLVRTHDWEAAIRAVERGNFLGLSTDLNKKIGDALRDTGGLSKIFQAVVQELAVSEALPRERMEYKEIVSQFLRRHFIEEEVGTEQYGIPPQVIGSAIERADRIVALQYYEYLERNAKDADIKRFAARRRVRNLERYAEYLRSRGYESRARDMQASALQIRRQWEFGDEQFSDYPIVDTVSALPEPSEWLRGHFQFRLSKPHGKLRIEHMERFETVTVDLNKGQLLGDAKFSRVEGTGSDYTAWQVTDWNAVINLFHSGTSRRIVFLDESLETVIFELNVSGNHPNLAKPKDLARSKGPGGRVGVYGVGDNKKQGTR